MVRYCWVKNCRNNDKDNADLYFHVLPSKPENIREEWLRRIRKNGDMPKRLNICSEHFELECYERDLQSELLGTSPKPRLKPNAVPSIFLDRKPVKRRLTSEKRTLKNGNSEFIHQLLTDDATTSLEQPRVVLQFLMKPSR